MSEPRPMTSEYRLTRFQISQTMALQYIRTFWWILISVPVFGVLCFALSTDLVIRACGLICLLWPFSIPARSFIVTSKASRQLLKPTTLFLTEDGIALSASDGTGMKLKTSSVRSIRRSGAVLVVQTMKLGLMLVPTNAFLNDDDRQTFEALGVRFANAPSP